MQLITKIIFVISLLSCVSAMANSPENVNKVKDFAAKNNVKISINNDSQYNREDKQFVASFNLGYEFDLAGTGVSFGYFIDRNKLVTIGFSRLKSERIFQAEMRRSAVKVSYKVFTGNSFYINSGLYYLDSEYDRLGSFNVFDGITTSTLTSRFKRLGAQVRIGNQWQWDNFTIGVDWIGFGTDIIDIEDEGFKPDITEFNSTYLTLLSLQLGMSF